METKTIKELEQTIQECKTKLNELMYYQGLSLCPKREKEINYLQYLIQNNYNLINHLNN